MEKKSDSRLHGGFKWNRRYQYIDILMSGEFKRVLKYVVVGTASVLGLLIIIGLIFGSDLKSGEASVQKEMTWLPWDIFVQLTNPGIKDSASWFDITMMVLTNIAGIILINGLLLTCLVNWVFERRERFAKGESRYDNIRDTKFAVIIGGHRIVASLAKDLIGKYEYVLIQSQRNPEKLRQEISAEIEDEAQLRDVIIYSGDRSSWNNLADLNIEYAQEIYIIGEPMHIDGTSHDAINMLCWDLINEHIDVSRSQRIPCHIMFDYQSTFSAFQYTDLKLEHSKTFRFIPFSMYENWAQQVLIGGTDGNNRYCPLDGHVGLSYSSYQRVHLIIAGMSNMGMALAIEAAHVAHYPNFNNPHTGRPRTLITFIDRNAKREMMFFMGRFKELFQLARWRFVKAPDDVVHNYSDSSWDIYDTISEIAEGSNQNYPWNNPLEDERYGSPYFGGYLGDDFIDIDFEFIEGDIALPSIQKYIKDACADNTAKTVEYNSINATSLPDATSKTTIAICFPIAVEAMSAALYFDPSVYENVQQIWVQQSETGALVDAVRNGLTGLDNARFAVLRPFGMIDKCDYLTRINNLLPQLVAYAYSCLDKGTTFSKEYKQMDEMTFLNSVRENWIAITQEGGKSAIAKRWSNMYCANSFGTKIRALGVDLSTKGDILDSTMLSHLARVEHNRWVMEQLLLGIRPVDKSFVGKLPVEDKVLRTDLKSRNIHPDLVSNEVLGTTQGYDIGICKIIPIAMNIVNQQLEDDGQGDNSGVD